MLGVAAREVDLSQCLGFDKHGYAWYPADPSLRSIPDKNSTNILTIPFGKRTVIGDVVGVPLKIVLKSRFI